MLLCIRDFKAEVLTRLNAAQAVVGLSGTHWAHVVLSIRDRRHNQIDDGGLWEG